MWNERAVCLETKYTFIQSMIGINMYVVQYYCAAACTVSAKMWWWTEFGLISFNLIITIKKN